MKLSTFATIFLAVISISTATAIPGKFFDRFFVIIFENTSFQTAIQNPYLASLITRNNSVLLNNYFAVSHPSEPNYVATLFGSTAGILDDNFYSVDGTNLVDLLEAKGISWKAYMQDYPGACFTNMTSTSGLYVRKHNPFIIMSDVSTDPARCAKIVNADDIDNDLAADGLPQFSYYVPNMNNDAHDTNTTFAMSWFSPWFEERLQNSKFTDGTLFLITFDEDDTKGDNHIFASLLGSPVKPGGPHTDMTNYTHYSILKTLEDNWGLDNLGRNDTTATAFTNFLQGF
ncbi:9404_t:CDS:2 [Paraglomus brasilianum]|uniref:9404_t:CDS:1 n=1 Tax=Paraglomus brasilianum TaxID=144538 RepID=A0A9N9AUD4_9GLOM|nr:9404_t:CDS:2 [Paraglomus brasilianum]